MNLSSSWDHRFVDGYARDVATSSRFAFAVDAPTGLYALDPARPTVTLLARPIGDVQRTLPLVGPPMAVPPGQVLALVFGVDRSLGVRGGLPEATRLEVCEQVVRRLLTDRLARYSRSSVA